MRSLLKKDKGFTLIEIVLVLAIAGLILVIVFLAVSGAQKSRRDTQRKTDIGRIAAQLESYASNNNGAYPAGTAIGTFVSTYLTPASNFHDPSTNAIYNLVSETAVSSPTAYGEVAYATGHVCSGGAMTTTGATTNDYALVMDLESGGTVCRSNQ